MPKTTAILILAALAAASAPTRAEEGAIPAMAPDKGAIRSVTLSSGGLAEVVREVPVGAGAVEISVPLDQVNDVLKSLVVLGGQGRVRAISLGGLAPVEEVMRTMPFGTGDLASLPALLGRLPGTRVEAESAGRRVAGTVLGVGTKRGENGAETPMLSLLAEDGGAVQVALGEGVSVKILDAAVLAKITEASAALGRAGADGERRLRIVLDGAGTGSAELAYVVAAPIWKSAYRVVTDKAAGTARLQAWAVLENATGEDWKGVALTLASGAPVTLTQRLHERYWRQRPDVPVDVAGIARPRADAGGLAEPSMDMSAMNQEYQAYDQQRAAMAMAAPAPMAAPSVARAKTNYGGSAPTAAAEGTESDVSASFAIEGPVDVAAGDTLSVPILDRSVAAERVSLFQPGVAGNHPVAALSLKNDTPTSLPPGILTVYDAADGYVGDAELRGLPAGDERMVSFAVDRKVTIDSEALPERTIQTIKLVDGVLTAEVRERARTVYRIAGAKDAPRTVVVEHPRREGWTFSSKAPSVLTDTAHRLKTSVGAGETATVEAVDEILQQDTVMLVDADPQLLLSWASDTSDPRVREALLRLSQARTAMMAVSREIDEAASRRDEIATEQARMRDNLRAVPAESELARDYLADMKASEEELSEIARRQRALRGDLAERRAALEAVIRDF